MNWKSGIRAAPNLANDRAAQSAVRAALFGTLRSRFVLHMSRKAQRATSPVLAAVPYRPVTRWCFSSELLDGGIEPWASPKAGLASGSAPEREFEAMRAALRRNLQRRQWKVAIWRYLMLLAYDVEVPHAEAELCRDYILGCPPAELSRIAQRVDAFVKWTRIDAAAEWTNFAVVPRTQQAAMSDLCMCFSPV